MLAGIVDTTNLSPHESQTELGLAEACHGVDLLVAAGAAKTRLISAEQIDAISTLKLAIDLNAVAPSGIEGVEVMDKANDHSGRLSYGAIGIGGMKMKIHEAAVKSLFQANDRVLDTLATFELGLSLT